MAEIAIGEAALDEREWCARLMAASDPWITLGRDIEQCRLACGRPETRLFVARDRERACGFMLIHPRGLAGSPYIASIAVDPQWRNAGVGSCLLQFAEDLAAASSRWIFLCVSSFNTGARKLYERRGYRQVGEFADYVIEGASEILMQKRLDRV